MNPVAIDAVEVASNALDSRASTAVTADWRATALAREVR